MALFWLFLILSQDWGQAGGGALLHRGVEIGARPAWCWNRTHACQAGEAGRSCRCHHTNTYHCPPCLSAQEARGSSSRHSSAPQGRPNC